MDETVKLSGARFKKDAASVKGFIGFTWTKGRFVLKKKKKKKKGLLQKYPDLCGTWLDCPWVPKNFNG